MPEISGQGTELSASACNNSSALQGSFHDIGEIFRRKKRVVNLASADTAVNLLMHQKQNVLDPNMGW